MAEQRRIDVVQVALSRGTIEMPWQSRQELLAESSHLESMRSVTDAFESVGTSRPVTLTQEQKGELLGVIEFWANQAPDGYEGLPEGIYELRNALTDDLHDAGRSAD
jgi:hypothetical protein